MNEVEIWLPVVGCNRYEVSNFGAVRSLNYKGHIGVVKMLSPAKTTKGYLAVSLVESGEIKRCFVHRLVAKAFIPNPDNLPEVNHKDGDKLNNAKSNLEWNTSSQNSKHAFEIGLRIFTGGRKKKVA